MTRQRVPAAVKRKLTEARVAHLATLDKRSPHIVPACFAFDGKNIYTAIDRKPKKQSVKELQRVRNIRANPQVGLMVDEYDEEWRKLWYVLVRGRAEIIDGPEEQQRAISLLRCKYSQYRMGLLPDEAHVIRIIPDRIAWWGKI